MFVFYSFFFPYHTDSNWICNIVSLLVALPEVHSLLLDTVYLNFGHCLDYFCNGMLSYVRLIS